MKGRYEQGEISRDRAMRPRVISRILLNKWQRQKENDYQRWLEEKECQRQQEEEMYKREQAESHWNCLFFTHCWNKGLKLPTRNNCPECSEQYWEFKQFQANHRSIHDRIEYQYNDVDRCLKIEAFMIDLEIEFLIKTRLIMKKKMMRKSGLAERIVASRRFNKMSEKEGYNA